MRWKQPTEEAQNEQTTEKVTQVENNIDNSLNKSKSSMEFILSIMRITRFLMMCSLDMNLVEIFQRVANFANTAQGKQIDAELANLFKPKKTEQEQTSPISFLCDVDPSLRLSKDWKKRSNFFTCNDFFASFVLKFIILMTKSIEVFHTKESPINSQNCQTLTIMLNSAIEMMMNNFKSY